ncbi:MAG: Bax inhibitor-1 family protein [Nevskia sp.]|nr:Bax inhibitor-1 family protein [Nevskia sp.]
MQTQAINRSRPLGDTLALVFLLTGAGLVVTAVVAVASVPLAVAHSSALMTFGVFGGFALLLLASWVCSRGGNFAAALLYGLFCAANGALLAPLAAMAAHHRETAQWVYTAAVAALAIVAILALVAAWLPQLFIDLGQFLLPGLMALLVLSMAALFTPASPMQLALDACGILLFCGYVLYDVSAIVSGEHDNPVRGAIELYLDVVNLFLSLLDLLLRLFDWTWWFGGDIRSGLSDASSGPTSTDSWSLSDLFNFFDD